MLWVIGINARFKIRIDGWKTQTAMKQKSLSKLKTRCPSLSSRAVHIAMRSSSGLYGCFTLFCQSYLTACFFPLDFVVCSSTLDTDVHSRRAKITSCTSILVCKIKLYCISCEAALPPSRRCFSTQIH